MRARSRNQWDSTYPALELLPDGTIVATTYGHWTEGEPAYAVRVRPKMEELDARVARAGVPSRTP